MRYEDFVNELRALIEQTSQLKNKKSTCDNPDFKKWRHQVTDLILRVENLGYTINCDISGRNFTYYGGYSHDPSEKEMIAAYNNDLLDTVTELETIIEHFNKYGDPKSQGKPTKVKISDPEKITLNWLFQHVPVNLWLTGLSLLISALVLGIAVGQSQLYADLSSKLNAKNQQAAPNKSKQKDAQ